jgi:diacylglycerol kinase (ATP)
MVLNGGRHVNDPNIIYTKTRKVVAKVKHGEQMKINLDGEYGGDAPMTFVNLRQHIEMFANVDEIPDKALSVPEDIAEKAEGQNENNNDK